MTLEAHYRIPSTHQPKTFAVAIAHRYHPVASLDSITLRPVARRTLLLRKTPPKDASSGQGLRSVVTSPQRSSRNLRLQVHWVIVTLGTFRISLLIWRTSVHHGLQLPATTSRPQILYNTTSCQSTCATSAIGRYSTRLFQASVPPSEQ
jgi:hypothetical protein